MSNLIKCLILILFSYTGYGQPLVINWQQCYGGSQGDGGISILKSLTGYVIFGTSNSSDGQVPSNHGKNDYWLIFIDSSGNITSSKTYGGSDDDFGEAMKPTPDGGYILCGNTFSQGNNGNVTGNHGSCDYWIVKVDSTGGILWSKCFGGTNFDEAVSMESTFDSNYLIIGFSNSNNGNVSENHGFYDYWVLKIGQDGNIKWEKSFGGTSYDQGMCISATKDGGSILGGWSESDDGNETCNSYGIADVGWVIKLDSNENIEWQNCFGGYQADNIVSIIPTEDSGYMFAGTTYTINIPGYHGGGDFWVVKIDHWGSLVWQKCYGGSGDESASFIKQSKDGNFFVGGLTYSNDGDVSGNHSSASIFCDMWLIKISLNGTLIWQQCFGGDASESLSDLLELPGGRMILLGSSNTSDNSGNVQCTHHGSSDVWLLSVKDTTYTGIGDKKNENPYFNIYPNPANDHITIKLSKQALLTGLKAKVINSLGQSIANINFPENTNEITWDTKSVAPGIYFIIGEEPFNLIKRKFVIIR